MVAATCAVVIVPELPGKKSQDKIRARNLCFMESQILALLIIDYKYNLKFSYLIIKELENNILHRLI